MVIEVKIVIEPFIGGRADIEARLRPNAQDRRRHDMGGRMANALQLAYSLALFERLAFNRLFGSFHSEATLYQLQQAETNANGTLARFKFSFGRARPFS